MSHPRIPLFTAAALCCALLLPHAGAAATHDPYEKVRETFQQAYEQVDAPAAKPHPDSEALRMYPLYPYLQAARIRRALADAGDTLGSVDERAQTFTTYYESEPVGRSLRRAWLSSLAVRGHWEKFLQQYREALADDALECQSFTARIELGRTAELTPLIARRWLTPRSLPDCQRAFDWLRTQNALTPELIEQRARLALKENNSAFAREIAAFLPAERAAPLLRWASLLEQPQRQIEALIAAPSTAVDDEALLAGWTRLARTNRDLALQRFDALVRARGLTDASASRYALALALALSWDRNPEALRYFDRVAPADLDDYALEWQARAAIWNSDWQRLTNTIAAMSDTQRGLTRWRYWAARAAERNDDPKLARQLYESTLTDDNYYSAAAAARLGQTIAPHPERIVVDAEKLKEIEQLPALLRARELFRCDLRDLANQEWSYGVDMLPQVARPQAVHLASRWGWYDQAIMTAALQRLFNDYRLLYPQPFDRQVRAAARLSKLPPELIYGVMRQESLYRPDAVSAAGARGLLQMLPATAGRTATAWKQRKPTPDALLDPDVSVVLGAAHLSELIDRFGGQTIIALAAYNAGPNAAARWIPQQPVEADVWIENIPYNETRSYVQRILWHTLVFTWLKSGEPQKTDEWLSRVGPLRS
ncbi:MAG TPA: transglycosylase SLT domain-containing protein [Steroidobacteraceae bacterium]|nr:transglycosylase SLT domain-containing protein [Steroidobacteraceae bacterium]